jgi:hypothetical protein
MADETSPVQSETPDTGTPATGNPATVSETPQKPNVTLEEALARIADLEHSGKNAREQADRQAKKLLAYEKAEQEKKDAELSEIERVKKQHADLQSQHEAYTRQMQARITRYEVERAAANLNIIDPDAAVRLLDLDQLEYDDNGSPTNAEKLLEKLIKAKPYLAPPAKQPEAEPEQTTPASTPHTRTPALPAMNPGRSSIAAPNTVPDGQPVRLADVFRRP